MNRGETSHGKRQVNDHRKAERGLAWRKAPLARECTGACLRVIGQAARNSATQPSLLISTSSKRCFKPSDREAMSSSRLLNTPLAL